MKITAISAQVRDKNRVNISVDGSFRFSLDIYQLTELSIKTGDDYSEAEIVSFESESQFGKVYMRALAYCLMRPHSAREIKDYLNRKTKPSLDKNGQIKIGISTELAKRVFNRLTEKGYVNDESFARYWIENRATLKGASRRKLIAELRSKGVDSAIIERLFELSSRNDTQEIKKILAKKRARYPDDRKLMAYLARQGFGFETIKQALRDETEKS